MSTAALRCVACTGTLEPDDRFCGTCGSPAATPSPGPTCPGCGETTLPDDRFCATCGHALAAAATPAPAPRDNVTRPASKPAAAVAPARDRIPSDAVLIVRREFCRACGVDVDTSVATCPECGVATAPLPPRIDGPIGSAYGFRRGLRKRTAVVIAAADGAVDLLFESGEVSRVAVADLPKPTTSPVSDGTLAPARTPQGELLRLAEACRRSLLKGRWNTETFDSAALGATGDVTTARLVALDALAFGRVDFVQQLPLRESERLWLAASHAAATGDASGALDAIAKLPATRYRPKLGLLVVALADGADDKATLRAIEPHLAAYLDDEPIAALLHRSLGLSSVDADELPAALASGHGLLRDGPLPKQLAAEIAAGLQAVAGDEPSIPQQVTHVPANVRAMLARSTPRPGILRREDVDAIPLSLLDDLVGSGALPVDVALAGASTPSSATYLRARFAPQLLTDRQVAELEHDDERIRRAFCNGELEQLADNDDSPTLRHYRALLAARRKRASDVTLDDVAPEARPTVEDILGFIAAKADRVPFSERLTERVLADPTVWPILVEIAGSTSIDPTPQLRSRFAPFTEWLALHQAREHLFTGEWQAAVRAADRCLDLARGEPVRDEAQNLKACGLHYLGRDGEAIKTLEEAIEGAYSESLLANIGIVAAGLQPEVAARHLGRLIAEAPTIAMRVAAAHRALSIWSTSSDTASWRNSDDSPLPDAFQDALHDLVVDDIELDDFREFATLLALRDSDWLGDPKNIAASPHRNSLEARFYVARAGDLIEMVKVMGEAIAAGPPPQWVLYERDSLRSAAVDILFDNLDEPDSTFGGVALAMFDSNVLADADDRVLFHGLGVAGLAYHLSERKAEVVDAIVGRVHTIRRDWQALDSEARTRLDPIVELATRRVAINRMLARDREMSEAIDLFNSAIDLGRHAEYGSPAHREAMRRVSFALNVARSAREDLRAWPPLLDHKGAADGINATIEQTRELERRCLNILT